MHHEEKDRIFITIDQETVSVPKGCTYHDLACDRPTDKEPVALVMEDHRLRELHHTPKDGASVRFLTLGDDLGYKAYIRSMTMLLLAAADHVTKGSEGGRIHVHFAVSDGIFCTMEDASLLSEELLKAVEEEMHRMVEAKLRIVKSSISTAQAAEIFGKKGMPDKQRLMHYRRASRTNVYTLDGYTDYNYGSMLYDTSLLGTFDLMLYKEGFVLRYGKKEDTHTLPAFEPDEGLFGVQDHSRCWGESLHIENVSDLNDRIVEGEAKSLLLTMEAYQEKQIANIAEAIASDRRRRVVMIAGPSSSGKTTFSHRLSTQLTVYGLKPHPIPVDDYFKNREETPKNPDGSYNFECLEALDTEQFNKDITALLAGERVEMPSFNFKTGKREYKGKYLKLNPGEILVIEGIHCLNDALSFAIPAESKFKIYISALTQLNLDEHNRIATTDGRLLRRIIRDARTRGTSAEQTIAMWPSVRAGEENYIFPYQESADVMFNSALIYELSVLKIYAEPLLFGIAQDSPYFLEAKRLLKFLEYFVPLPAEDVPFNSLLREFVGGGCFDI